MGVGACLCGSRQRHHISQLQSVSNDPVRSIASSTVSSESLHAVIGLIGHNVTLPCRYDTQTHGVLSFCWGRGKVPTSKCSDTVLSSQDGAVQFRQASRYQLLGRETDGDIALTILNAQWSDHGVYGCRAEIPGWFNDYKVNTHLVMEEGNSHANCWSGNEVDSVLSG
uniref:Ig-like domain-containing protein n=1 Tax=Scophthalmus maximus TaxID=52904 RepID=A0A8D2ZSF8_SCOMX